MSRLCCRFSSNVPAMSAQQNPPAAAGKPQIAAVAEPEENTAVSADALQKATQNPVANLISVPIQNNVDFNYRPL